MYSYQNIFIFTLFITFSVQIAQADQVILDTGEVLTGQVVSRTNDQVVISHPVLGELTIPANRVQSVTIIPPADTAPPIAPAAENESTGKAESKSATPDNIASDTAAHAEADPPTTDSILEGWKSQIELSFAGAEGNTQNNNFRAGFESKRETASSRAYVDASYFLATESSEKTSDEATAGFVMEWPIKGSRLFAFVDGRFDYDQFQAWDYRVNTHGGLGYEIIKEEKLNVKVRGGVGALREFGGDSDDEIRPEALAGVVAEWKATEAITLTAHSTIYPDLDDTGEFRLVSGAAAVIAIDKTDGISLKFGIDNEYESQTTGDAKHNDLKYYGALIFQF